MGIVFLPFFSDMHMHFPFSAPHSAPAPGPFHCLLISNPRLPHSRKMTLWIRGIFDTQPQHFISPFSLSLSLSLKGFHSSVTFSLGTTRLPIIDHRFSHHYKASIHRSPFVSALQGFHSSITFSLSTTRLPFIDHLFSQHYKDSIHRSQFLSSLQGFHSSISFSHQYKASIHP